jgi:hypothetical protein
MLRDLRAVAATASAALLPLLPLVLSSCARPVGPGGDDDGSDDDDDSASGNDDDSSPSSGDDDDDLTASSVVDAVLSLLAAPSADASDLDAVLRAIAWESSWPYREGERWLFLTRWDDAAGEISLVGDPFGWEPGVHPAIAGTDGVHYGIVLNSEDFQEAPEGALWKWHSVAGDSYLAPPESTSYGFDGYGEFGYVRPPANAPWRERFPDLDSAFLDEPRSLRALLPAGFQPLTEMAAGSRALLMHDGQNVFHPDAIWGGWRADEALPEAGLDEDVVILAVDNAADRMDAYTHTADDPFGDESAVGGRAADYHSLLQEEALPFFRARYGIDARGGSLAVAGSSLGGLVSLWLAMAHPDEQACVIAMSPTLGWGAFDPTLDGEAALPRLWPESFGHGSAAVYLDSGGDEGSGCGDGDGDGVLEDGDDGDNYCVTVQMRDVLEGLGYAEGVDLFHFWEPFATHDEAAWAERLPEALLACDGAGWAGPD